MKRCTECHCPSCNGDGPPDSYWREAMRDENEQPEYEDRDDDRDNRTEEREEP
jgi:hypothetical protein